MNSKMDTFCKNLPKIELHAHLNGSLSKAALLDLGGSSIGITKYQCNLLEKNKRSLEECFEVFKIAHSLTNNPSAVYKATSLVIGDFYKDNCIYLEIRTTPRCENFMTKEDYIEAVVQAITNHKFDIIVKLILSIDRTHSYEESKYTMDLIIRMKAKYPLIIVGVDLCGNPSKGKFYPDLFYKAREHGLSTTLHCAEVRNEEETMKILEFVPDRLGHATFLNPEGGGGKCWEKYKENPITVECCLTSNVLCGTVSEFGKHHVKKYIEQNLPFCISTDDKGVFNTTLTEEFLLMHKYFMFNQDDLLKLSYSAATNCFGSSDDKKVILDKLDNWKKAIMK